MPSQVQFRRGTTAQNNSFIGAVGEISIDTDKDALRIHDGAVVGGFEQAKADLTNVSGATNLSLSGITTTNSLSIGSTQVISSARQLQNIVSLDATTTATIESAVSAAPNDFTSLNISGLSTFSGITTHTTSLFGRGASFSGVITATSFVGAIIGTVTGTATSTINIPNLTGAITSNNTTTSLGSFTSTQLATALTDETGSGSAVFATSPILVTPVLGTPSSGTLTNCTGLPITGISGLAANVATFLATPSSENLISAVTNETGTGALVFATSPTLVTPVLGTPSSGTLTSCTELPIVAGTTGTLSVARGGTGVTTSTGTDSVVLSTSPTLVTPLLGTPSSGNLANCTFPTLNQNTTGSSASCTGNATTATTADAVNTANTYQVSALGIGQSAGTGTELDLAGRYAQTSIAVAALDIDCSLGNYFTKTVGSSVTFTVSNIPASRTYTFALQILHTSGTITWFSGVKWPKNTAPTLTTYREHTFIFTTHDEGICWFGAALVDYTY